MRGQPESAESTPLPITTIHVNSSSAQLSTAARTAVIPTAPPLPSNIVADSSVSSSTVDTANAAAIPPSGDLGNAFLDELNNRKLKLKAVGIKSQNNNAEKKEKNISNILLEAMNKRSKFMNGVDSNLDDLSSVENGSDWSQSV